MFQACCACGGVRFGAPPSPYPVWPRFTRLATLAAIWHSSAQFSQMLQWKQCCYSTTLEIPVSCCQLNLPPPRLYVLRDERSRRSPSCPPCPASPPQPPRPALPPRPPHPRPPPASAPAPLPARVCPNHPLRSPPGLWVVGGQANLLGLGGGTPSFPVHHWGGRGPYAPS